MLEGCIGCDGYGILAQYLSNRLSVDNPGVDMRIFVDLVTLSAHEYAHFMLRRNSEEGVNAHSPEKLQTRYNEMCEIAYCQEEKPLIDHGIHLLEAGTRTSGLFSSQPFFHHRLHC